MKAIICNEFGLPDAFRLEEIQTPAPGDNDVLVEVYSASVTYSTLMLVRGKPFIGRLMGMGLFKPKQKIPGADIAGRIKTIGKNVSRFQPGDEVFGDLSNFGRGGFAEYVCAPENALALKPINMTFAEAAAVPEAALVALQALRDHGHIQKGQKVLIYGASGGIGTFAIQIAKYYGAEVTGVCGTANTELVRSLGADHVIDYHKEDFTKNGVLYDLIVATAGYRPIFDYKRALSTNGRYISTGGSMKQIFQAMLIGPFLSMTSGKKLKSMLVKPNKDLDFITSIIEDGKLRTVLDRTYRLSEAAEAFRYYSEGHTRGKLVISVDHDRKSSD